MTAQEEFALWLRRQLDAENWTQQQLSDRSGVSRTHIARILSGERVAGLDFFKGMARAFRLSLAQMLVIAGEMPDTQVNGAAYDGLIYRIELCPTPQRQKLLDVFYQLIDLADQSSSPAPEIQLQSLDDVPAWLATLTPEERASLADAIELTFPAEEVGRRKALA